VLYFFNFFFISIFFIFLSLLSQASEPPWTSTEIIQKALNQKLDTENQWKLLLHYKPRLLGSEASQVTGDHFFLSPEGHKDPRAELIETIQTLMAKIEGNPDESPQCRYFARKLWLSEKLNIPENQWPSFHCPLYQRYRKILNADSISFVFSSYYTNSPGSAFGHTLFRINRHTEPGLPRIELLDHGIGYAANTTTQNPLFYALFGLTGVFKGTFTNLPYYYKIREYNDYESRDLWSYDLDLSATEKEMLIRHLWELGDTHFDYYFFNQNCAFHMLTVLDAAAPRFHLSDISAPYLIPADSIKLLFKQDSQPPLVKNITYRPSVKKMFKSRFEKLNGEQQKIFLAFAKNEDLSLLLERPSDEEKVLLLDTAIDFIDTQYPDNFLSPTSPGALIKNKILQVRSKIPLTSPDFKVSTPEEERPDRGHPSARIGLSTEPGIDFRFALHDLYDPSIGYPDSSEIEFGHFHISKLSASELDLNNNRSHSPYAIDYFHLFRVSSYNPLSFFEKNTSWRAQLSFFRTPDQCSNCYQGGFTYDVGYSFLWTQLPVTFLTYGFLGTDLYSTFYQYNNISIGPKMGGLLNLSSHLKWGIEVQGSRNLTLQNSEFQWSTESLIRWSPTTNWAIETRWELGSHKIAPKTDSSGGLFVFTGYHYF